MKGEVKHFGRNVYVLVEYVTAIIDLTQLTSHSIRNGIIFCLFPCLYEWRKNGKLCRNEGSLELTLLLYQLSASSSH